MAPPPMPATRTDPAKRVRPRVPVKCPVCDKVVNRKADLTRHMQTHNQSAGRFTCPYDDCSYATLQKSNLTTHMRTHTGEKRFECQDSPGLCSFRTSDPAAFTRHRKKKHGYIPQARSRKGSIATDHGHTSSTATTSSTPIPHISDAQDDFHPSPVTSDDEHESDHESDSSNSSSSISPHSPRSFSRESSDSEVDEFIAKTIDSLKDVVGRRRQRGHSGSFPPIATHPPSTPSERQEPSGIYQQEQ